MTVSEIDLGVSDYTYISEQAILRRRGSRIRLRCSDTRGTKLIGI
jgi:hypothetical protein